MTFQRKITAILIASTTGLILCVAAMVYPRIYQEQLEGLQQKVRGVAATGALSVDSANHAALFQQDLDLSLLKSPAYQKLQGQLRKILSANPGIRYVWTMIPSKMSDEMIFVGDVGGRAAQPGLRYNAAGIRDLWKSMELMEPTADQAPVKDPWGVSISGYAPIRDAHGKFVALLGVDVYTQQLAEFRQKFMRFLIVSLLLGLVCAGFTGALVAHWIARPVQRLVRGMERVKSGHLTHEIELKTNDEFETAANTFNQMTASLRKAQQELQESFFKSVQSLISALEAKDPYTRGHSVSVSQYSKEMASVLRRSSQEIEKLEWLASLHDIGKIGIHDKILQKPGPFNEEERQVMEQHPMIGRRILAPLGLTDDELALILHHHEREDGRGYPYGLNRSHISDLLAIVIVADAYDSMTSDRPYRTAMKPPQALAELRRHTGTQFRAEIVEALAQVLQAKGLV